MPYSSWVEQRRNLLRNPSFEVDLAGVHFNRVTGARVSDWSADGGYSLALTRTSDASTDAYADILPMVEGGQGGTGAASLKPNTTYTLEATYTLTEPFQSLPVGAVSGEQMLSLFVHLDGTNHGAVGGVNEVGEHRLSLTFTTPSAFNGYNTIRLYAGDVPNAPSRIRWDALSLFEGPAGGYFDGDTPDDPALPSLYQYRWLGTANASASVYETRTWEPTDSPLLVATPATVQDVLYGDRQTSYRYEVLEHSNGIDYLIGTLDGVSDGALDWVNNAAVKGSGRLTVLDLAAAQPGMLRVADLTLESVRIRPVQAIEGLPENPLGTFLVSAATESWADTGRVWNLHLLDRTTVPQQDAYDQSYAVAEGTPILAKVKEILASAGEYMDVDPSTLTTSTGMAWEAGTSKLKIINDLLDVAGFSALWMDGYGNFRVTPRVLPADRSLTYDLLGLPRELRDGELSIYLPDWTRERDSFNVPNKVIAVQAAGGSDTAALTGTWTNEDASSPYSYPARGRWIPHVLDSVDTPEGTEAEIIAFLQARARATLVQMSAVQAEVKLTHLPIPARVGDVIRFANVEAGLDSRHIITRMSLDLSATGLMRTTLQEVISL